MRFTMQYVIGNIKEFLQPIILVPGQSIVIGRTSNADYCLKGDRAVSSKHACVSCEKDSAYIQDLGSRNGTYVNEDRVAETKLHRGDKIRIGSCVFRVTIEQDSYNSGHRHESERLSDDPSTLAVNTRLVGNTEKRQSEDGFCFEDSVQFGFPSATHHKLPLEYKTERAAEVDKAEPVETIESNLDEFEQRRMTVTYQLPEGGAGTIVVQQDQIVTVGSGGVADFDLADSDLELLQFRLEIKEGTAQLIDENSNPGTYVNGQMVSRAVLADGDVVDAGRTRFQVTLHGLKFNESANHDDHNESAQVANFSTSPVARSSSVQPEATQNSELVSLTDQIASVDSVVEIVREMATIGPFYLIVDFSRFAGAIPNSLDSRASMLFDWLPAGAEGYSPHLIPIDQLEDWPELLGNGWGCDGIVGLNSHIEYSQLVAEFRQLIRGDEPSSTMPNSISGYCWPTIMSSQVNSSKKLPGNLADQVYSVFFELESGRKWQMVTRENLVQRFKTIGTSYEIENLQHEQRDGETDAQE